MDTERAAGWPTSPTFELNEKPATLWRHSRAEASQGTLQHELLGSGIGITNLVARTTATAAELSADELREGARILIDKVERFHPKAVAFLGISTYRVGFGALKATIGRQPNRLAEAAVWVLPNPSGLNASWQLPRLIDAYRELRSG